MEYRPFNPRDRSLLILEVDGRGLRRREVLKDRVGHIDTKAFITV